MVLTGVTYMMGGGSEPWIHGHVRSGDNPKHSQINVDSDFRLSPTPQETTESM